MAAIFPTGLRNGVKGLDANRYATKKTVAQGMLDIALLTSNASQLKYVLQVGPKHEFYTLLLVLISISIVLQASAGVLAIITSFLDAENGRHKKIADWLYHISVAMMTCVVFCDVIKMTFGLDPALSVRDFLSNKSTNFYDMFFKVVSVLVMVVLGAIFDINKTNDHRSAEILNNTSLGFKFLSIGLNVIISIFYSIQVDNMNLTIQ